MTKKEAVQILAILKAAYPSSYNGMTKEEANGTISVWAMQFADMPADIVMMAIHKLISSCKFPPSVAEVKDKIKSIHWETYDIITGYRGSLSEDLRAKYQRIYELTSDYKYGKGHEPKVLQMVTQARLGSGE
jgi:hypothetical protein